jgi:predicted HAD superfamily Cof-like phosphohydrolase
MKAKKNIMTELEKVKEFQEIFGLTVREMAEGSIEPKDFLLRYELMKEENEEYLDACKKGDLVEVADALGDMLYILCGTIITHGLQHKISEIFHEIHASNLSKLDENGKPIYREDGKVLKGPNYFRPNIKGILEQPSFFAQEETP